MTRWGIIYCPRKGLFHSHKFWDKIRAYLQEKGVEYDFVQSESSASVERLASMLVKNGYNTVVVVGGDSALNRALNGIVSAGGHESVALGVIPYGYANDFAHFWGIGSYDYRRTVDWIMNRRLRPVDVGLAEWESGEKRYFLNCLNVGLVADITAIRCTAKRLGVFRHAWHMLTLLFHRMEHKMMFRVNTTDYDQSVMNLCVGSCRAYGLTPNAVPYSGLLDVSIVSHPELKQLAVGMWLLVTGKFLNYKRSIAHRTRSAIEVTDTGGACIAVDGVICHAESTAFKVTLMPEYIQFIIPPLNF